MNSFVAVCLLAVVGLSHGDGVGLGGHGPRLISAPIIRTAAVAPVVHPIVTPIVTPIVRPILRTVPIGLGWGSGLYGRGLGGYGGYGLYGRGLGHGGYGLYGRGLGLGGYGLYGSGLGHGGLGMYRRPLIGSYGGLYGGKYLG